MVVTTHRITGGRNGGRDSPVLTIGNAILSDAGVYACSAKNEYGQTRQAMFLSVVPIPKMRREYVVKVGDQLRLPCADETAGKSEIQTLSVVTFSGSARKPKKCHCKRLSLRPMILGITRSILGQKKLSMYLTSVTVSDKACNKF